MQATIKYNYDSAGQRASLIAGGDGKETQSVTIDIANGDIDLMTVASDGTLSANAAKDWKLIGWYPDDVHVAEHTFSTVPSPADLIVFLRERAARKIQLQAELDANKEAARTAAEDERRKQSDLIDADLAGSEAYEASGHRYYHLASDDPRRAQMRARWDAQRAADAAREAHLKKVKETPMAKPRWTTLLADGTYQFDIPTPDNGDWAKRVESVDSAAKNGYAFEGAWLSKPGQGANLPAGELLLVGGKYWSGSRKRGDWCHVKHLYVVTPAGVRYLCSGEKCKAIAITYIALSPAERIARVLAATVTAAADHIATLAALDATEYADCVTEIYARRDSWIALREACRKVLDAPPADEAIKDVDSAAAAIVAAGFRALSKSHHPDAGGSTETMALLSQARAQLREMLTLAGGVR
jgi:hypothetical protein